LSHGKGLLKEGVAPSYFLEGMLWDVPPEHFGESYGATFAASMNGLLKANKSELACANDLYWLLRDNAAVCWNEADFHTFMSAAIKQWNEWEG